MMPGSSGSYGNVWSLYSSPSYSSAGFNSNNPTEGTTGFAPTPQTMLLERAAFGDAKLGGEKMLRMMEEKLEIDTNLLHQMENLIRNPANFDKMLNMLEGKLEGAEKAGDGAYDKMVEMLERQAHDSGKLDYSIWDPRENYKTVTGAKNATLASSRIASTFYIRRCSDDECSSGSGVYVKFRGIPCILTNHHVLKSY